MNPWIVLIVIGLVGMVASLIWTLVRSAQIEQEENDRYLESEGPVIQESSESDGYEAIDAILNRNGFVRNGLYEIEDRRYFPELSESSRAVKLEKGIYRYTTQDLTEVAHKARRAVNQRAYYYRQSLKKKQSRTDAQAIGG